MRNKNALNRSALGSRKGESLVETLVAILITVLALSILATAIISSSRITSDSAASMKDYHEANSAVSARDDGCKLSGTGTLTLEESGEERHFTADASEDIEVIYYSNDKSGSVPVVAYELSD